MTDGPATAAAQKAIPNKMRAADKKSTARMIKPLDKACLGRFEAPRPLVLQLNQQRLNTLSAHQILSAV